MASKYWIKLYHEILDDPKMGKLPDNLWRRAIELFLLAGDLNRGGELLDTEGIAWKLRITCNETLQNELQALQQCNIVTLLDNGNWLVVHFANRQEAVDVNERVKRFRERQKKIAEKEAPTENVTKRYTDKESDKESDKAAKPPNHPKPEPIPAVKVHVEVTGKYLLNKAQIKEIAEVVGDTPIALEKWRSVVKAWVMRDYKPTRIDGMLEWFRDGIPIYQKHENGFKNGSHPPANKSSPVLNKTRLEQLQAESAKEIYDPLKGT